MSALILMFIKENWGKILVAAIILGLIATIGIFQLRINSYKKDVATCLEEKGTYKAQADEFKRAVESSEKVQTALRTEITRLKKENEKDSKTCTAMLEATAAMSSKEKQIKDFIDSLPCPKEKAKDYDQKIIDFYNGIK